MAQSPGRITETSNHEVYSDQVSYVTDTNPPINYFEEPVKMNNFSNMFPPVAENSGSQAGAPRLAPSPMQAQQLQPNGNGAGMNGMNVGMPMSAGQQMDVNLLMQKVLELSEVLKENREKTAGIIAGAEELAVSIFISEVRAVDRNLTARLGNFVQRWLLIKQDSLTLLFNLRLVLLPKEQALVYRKPMLRSLVSSTPKHL
jgi:hypothetical protein